MEKLFSITQYNTAIQNRLQVLPKVWVKGVITQLNVRGRLAYITLGEFEADNPNPKAVLQVTLWASDFHAYNRRFSQLALPFELRAELKVSVLLEAFFYVPWGRFQPRILSIDENFTQGELGETRRRTLERLKAEGLLDRNRALPFPPVPLKVGLITAPFSAAYQDFTTLLLDSGFSFEILFCAARMQGNETEKTVVAALKTLQAFPLDVICVIRGGGSRTDLVYFDSEAICRAIAASRIPVLTGIGHEIDRSLADIVAFENRMTPTDCAKFLETKALEAFSGLLRRHGRLRDLWELETSESRREIGEAADRLKRLWEGRKTAEGLRFERAFSLLHRLPLSRLGSQREKLGRSLVGLERGPGKILALESMRLKTERQRFQNGFQTFRFRISAALRERRIALAASAGRRFEGLRNRQTAGKTRLEAGVNRALAREGERFAPLRRRLALQWRRGLRHAREQWALKKKLVRSLDPRRLLARGFAVVYGRDGSALQSLRQALPGTVFFVRLKDGVVKARAEQVEERET